MHSTPNKASKRRCIAEINVVPYVDVMLVLLVIFMVTAPLITQGVKVDLPTATTKPLPKEDEIPVVVTIDAQGSLYLNIAMQPNSAMQADALLAEVGAALVRSPKRQVVVRGDKHVNYDYVVQVMSLLQKAGVASVGLETSEVNV
jgi:biopolymer transport protein TolR